MGHLLTCLWSISQNCPCASLYDVNKHSEQIFQEQEKQCKETRSHQWWSNTPVRPN